MRACVSGFLAMERSWGHAANLQCAQAGRVPALHSMKTVHKSVLIWYSPQEMYELVAGVADYPKFLPWCDHARVLEAHDGGVTAEVGIAFSGVRQIFTTRNTHLPGSAVKMQ